MEECGMSEASRVYPLVAVAFVPSIRRSGGRACPPSPVAHEYLRDHQSARRRVHGVLSKRVADSSLEKLTDVVLKQSIIGRMLDYGDIVVSYTHLRAHETRHDLVCRLL